MKTNTKNRTFLQVGLILLLSVLVTGCADTVEINTGMYEVGFWSGLWHGMILPFSWLVSLFSDSTSIYAVYNNGGWYDFGFVIGVGGLTGGSSAASK